MSIKKAIKALVNENYYNFNDIINEVLSEKAINKLDDIKVYIGENYFGQVNELSKKTLGSYLKKAVADKEHQDKQASRTLQSISDPENSGEHNAEYRKHLYKKHMNHFHKWARRDYGVNKAIDKLSAVE